MEKSASIFASCRYTKEYLEMRPRSTLEFWVFCQAKPLFQHPYLLTLFLWGSLWILVGCSTAPKIYTMPAIEVETIREDIATVGVILVDVPAESEVLMPAKGFWGGARRGVVVGARLPVLIGFVSPIPGGTLLGFLVAPFTAVIGGVYGAVTAPSVQEVEAAEKALDNVVAEIRQMDLRATFVNTLVRMGNDRTGKKFVQLPETGVTQADNINLNNPSDLSDIDSILELKIEKTGLRGKYQINPRIDTFVQTKIRLVRTVDNFVLLEETFLCLSDEERNFQEWSRKENVFVEEFRSCVPELAEKIIDDFFLVYPRSES